MCKSQPADDKMSLIGTWSGHVAHYKIFGALKIGSRVRSIKWYVADDIG